MTRGEEIRKDNASLAKFIAKITHDCIEGNCLDCELLEYCDDSKGSIEEQFEEYLNK